MKPTNDQNILTPVDLLKEIFNGIPGTWYVPSIDISYVQHCYSKKTAWHPAAERSFLLSFPLGTKKCAAGVRPPSPSPLSCDRYDSPSLSVCPSKYIYSSSTSNTVALLCARTPKISSTCVIAGGTTHTAHSKQSHQPYACLAYRGGRICWPEDPKKLRFGIKFTAEPAGQSAAAAAKKYG